MNRLDPKTINIRAGDQNDQIHSFSHFAMATVFEIIISHQDYSYAEQVAQAAFLEIDRLELELSRFIENSDISRINNMAQQDTIIVGPDTLHCLEKCFDLKQITNGAFDITLGKSIDEFKNKNVLDNQDIVYKEKTKLKIHPSTFKVTLLSGKADIDLGGFGKGYAIDLVFDLLQDWGIESGFIHGGASSAMAFGSSLKNGPWEITLSHPEGKDTLYKTGLKNMALSGSGVAKENHIINPYTMQPVKKRLASWVFAKTAAVSDALSTAFMIMSQKEIEIFCTKNEDVSAIILEEDKYEPFYFGERFQ